MEINSARTIRLLIWILILSVPVSEAETSTAENALGQRVAEMFQVGFARGPRAMQESQRLYDSLQREASHNPRIDYAHGLVLMRLLRNKEAKADFLLATKRSGDPYIPAWQALIWLNFNAKEYDDGYDRLLEFTRLIHVFDRLPDTTRHDAVFWVGRVMAARELTLDSNQSRETWMQTEKKLTGLLSEGSIEAYNGGKEDVRARHSMLEDEIRQTREKDKERQAEQREKKLENIGKSLGAANDKRENLKKSAAEMKEEFEEQTTAFKKQMERAEKDYAFMERRGMTLMASMLTLDQQINLLQQNRGFNANRLAALQNQRFIFDTDFQIAAIAAQQVSMRAQKLTEDRAEYIAQYQKATGEIVQEDASVEKWKERTLKQATELKKAEKKPKPTATAVASKIQAATSFRTYVDLDPQSERDKVLLSFGITHETK